MVFVLFALLAAIALALLAFVIGIGLYKLLLWWTGLGAFNDEPQDEPTMLATSKGPAIVCWRCDGSCTYNHDVCHSCGGKGYMLL